MPNVLITSAGRRVELVQLFQDAVREHGKGGLIVAADAQTLAPALHFANRRAILPKVNDPRYIDELKSLIVQMEIDLIVPTIDPELPVLAKHKKDIESATGAWVMVAEPSIVEMTTDKQRTQEHILKNGLLAPHIFGSTESVATEDFPVIVKPREGSSSIGVNVVHTLPELEFHFLRTRSPMIQALAKGSEFTIDCFSDRRGKPITVVPRLRIATRGGEVLKGRIVKDPQIIEVARTLLEKTPMPGHSTLQCFKTDRGVEFIEINARFGGGAPMSIQAGANSCLNLLHLLDGEQLAYNERFEDGATFLRYDQSVKVRSEDVVDAR